MNKAAVTLPSTEFNILQEENADYMLVIDEFERGKPYLFGTEQR